MSDNHVDILLWVNFFILSITLLSVYYYSYKLKNQLTISEINRNLAEKYRILFNSTFEGVFQCDIKGRFLLLNKGGVKIFNFNFPDQLINSKVIIHDLFCDRDLIDGAWKEIINGQHISEPVQRAKKLNGEKFYIELSAHAVSNEQGELTHIEGIFRDVSLRVEMEKQIKIYSENLEKKVEEKTRKLLSLERKKIHLEELAKVGELTASIIHEVKNPLSSIKLSLQTLLKRVVLEDKDKRCLDMSVKEVSYLESILHNLLDFSKPEEMNFINYDINQVLELVINQIKNDFKNNGITIKRDFCKELIKVPLNLNRISQVFLNILINAKDAITGKGEIIVKSLMFKDDKIVKIIFEDTGVGIKKNKLEEIFEPFISTKENGTGLGLSIVNKIINAHNGEVYVQSLYGEGTKFIIKLPVVT